MVNEYWDGVYMAPFKYQRVGDPTMKYNCHGYATDHHVLVMELYSGIKVIIADEYQEVTWSPFEGEGIFSSIDHSVKVGYYGCHAPNIEDWGKLRTVSEKSSTSGIYCIDYYPGSGSAAELDLPGNLYDDGPD
jgi:hypothetical protein